MRPWQRSAWPALYLPSCLLSSPSLAEARNYLLIVVVIGDIMAWPKKKHIMGKLPSASVLDRASAVIGTWLCLHPHALTCPAHLRGPKVTRSHLPKTPAGSVSPEATVTARA